MLTVNAKIKEFFFDRLKVTAAVDKDRLRFLRNAGGFARKTARNSMKRKGKARKAPKNASSKAYAKWEEEIRKQPASPPGSPPFVHSDDPTRTLKNILFAYNTIGRSVIVGPVGLGKSNAPALQEYGGSVTVREKLASFTDEEIIDGPAGRDSRGKFTKAPRRIVKGRRWVPLNGRARQGQPTRTRRTSVAARPFMAPAVAKTQSKFKDLWFSGSQARAG